MITAWIGGALAATLAITVTLDPPPPARERVPAARVGPLIPGRGEIGLDGVVDEVAWGPREPLRPLANGARPTPAWLALTGGSSGLGIAVGDLPADHRSQLVIDPDGLGQRWWRLTLAEPVVVEVCSLGFRPRDEAWPHPEAAVPCRADDPVPWAHGAAWEVLVPWGRLPGASTGMRVGWVDSGPAGRGGTLAANGLPALVPAQARGVRWPGPAVAVEVAPDLGDGVWRARATVRPARGTWTWRRYAFGRELDHGDVVLVAGEGAWEMPDVEQVQVMVELAGEPAPGLPIRPAGSAAVRREAPDVTVAPLYGDAVILRFEGNLPVELPVRVRDAAGVLGEGVLALPGGPGLATIAAPPAWGTVWVEVAGAPAQRCTRLP